MNGRKKLSAPDHLSQLRWFKIVSWQRWCLTVGLVGFLHLHLEMPRWSQESGTVPFVFGFIIHVKSSWWTFAVKRSIGLRVDHRKRRCTHTQYVWFFRRMRLMRRWTPWWTCGFWKNMGRSGRLSRYLLFLLHSVTSFVKFRHSGGRCFLHALGWYGCRRERPLVGVLASRSDAGVSQN